MQTSFWAIFFVCLTNSLFSQTQVSGIINQYAKVNAIEPCDAKLSVDDGSPFSNDGTVLLIQMKGATINSSNSSSFGNIENIGGAGYFELNEVLSTNGNDVFLKNELLHNYDPSFSLQLVNVPIYTNVEVVGELLAKPWDGSTGGILALNAETLSLQAAINVSGVGFRGAQKMQVVSDCNFLTNADAYSYDISNWRGSQKGEGIASFIANKEHGRGAQANGGGGGNDHNSGGGGGGNLSNGGLGGKESVGGFGCDGDYPGLGGKACPNEPNRIYLGGGGGAGHDNNNSGSSGANGGGIAIIIAQTIQANGFSVLANGNSASLAIGDGAGGGGAGGAILLKTSSIIGDLNIVASGGNGGNVNNSADRCDGTGGGGGGGYLVTNATNLAQINLNGGLPGVNTVASSQCNGASNGATAGEAGGQGVLGQIPAAINEIVPFEILQQPTNEAVCEGLGVGFNFQVQGANLVYQWQINTGGSWQNVPNSPNYSGAASNELSIQNALPSLNGAIFRCLVTSPCISNLSSNEITLSVTDQPSANFTSASLGANSFQFQNSSTNASSYLWDFGDGSTSMEQNPLHNYAVFGDFTVILTAFGPCGEAEFVLNISVSDPNALPTAQFTADFTAGCSPLTVHFQNQSLGNNLSAFQWEFPGGSPSFSSLENPIVTYSQPGLFPVSLTASNSLGINTVTLADFIQVNAPPTANFSFLVSGQTVTFTNQSAAGTTYFWDFGDGNTSQESNPVHEYATPGLFNVTLTVSNSSCGSSIAIEVYLAPSATDEIGQGSGIFVYPNPASTVVTVFLKNENWNDVAKCRLLDITGKVIQSVGFQGDSFGFSIESLPTGIYFIEISDEQQLKTVRFVKQ